jgi:TatD DNase family protein
METEAFASRIAENVRRIFPTLEPPKPFYPDQEEELD